MKTVPSAHESSFGVHSSVRQAIKEATTPKKPGWKSKLLAKTTELLISSGNSVQNYTISKIHPKMAAILYQTISFTLLLHFDNANSSKTPISGISKIASYETSNTLPKELLQDLTTFWSDTEALVFAVTERKRQRSIRLTYRNPKSIHSHRVG